MAARVLRMTTSLCGLVPSCLLRIHLPPSLILQGYPRLQPGGNASLARSRAAAEDTVLSVACPSVITSRARGVGRMIRAYKFLLRPTVGRQQAVGEMLRDHCSLYNGALQERRDAYRHVSKTSIKYGDQSGQLNEIRVFDPELQGRCDGGLRKQNSTSVDTAGRSRPSRRRCGVWTRRSRRSSAASTLARRPAARGSGVWPGSTRSTAAPRDTRGTRAAVPTWRRGHRSERRRLPAGPERAGHGTRRVITAPPAAKRRSSVTGLLRA